MNKLRIALLHLQIKQGNTCWNRQLIKLAISIAAGYGANLVVTGELIESGEEFWRNIYLNSIPGDNYPFLEELKEMASKYKLNIIFGRAYRNPETNNIFSIYTHINDEGQVQAIYQKQVAETNLEGQVLTQGEQLVVTRIDCLNIGLLLGYNETVQTIINRYEEEQVDLIIGGLAPLRHPCNTQNINTDDIDVPLLLSNYNVVIEGKLYRGESIAIGEENSLKFCPICSEVIILDYLLKCEEFEVINRVNINQVVNCE